MSEAPPEPVDDPYAHEAAPALADADLPAQRADLLESLGRSEMPSDTGVLYGGETNQDHILGKLSPEDIRHRRYKLKNNEELVLASFPPRNSFWVGERREKAGLGDRKQPLTPERLHEIRENSDAAFSRVTRSEGGWQQRLLHEQTQELRRVDKNEDSGGGGLLSKLIGGGR